METLFRWSKFVDEASLEAWEARLIGADVTYTADKPVNRKRWQLSSYVKTREEADRLRAEYGGGVSEVRPDQWQPTAEPGVPFLLKIRSSMIVTESDDEKVLQSIHSEYPDRTILSFPPQLAFGTGSHPTTAGCLRFLVDIAQEKGNHSWSLLDLGCGSGILAIAAALLGAEQVLAVEIDDVALRHAIRNAERHGVSDRIEFLEGDAIPLLADQANPSFDIVAANLFSSLLIDLMPAFSDGLATHGDLVLSGFLTSQTRDVVAAAEKSHLELHDFLRRGKWVAARGRHNRAKD